MLVSWTKLAEKAYLSILDTYIVLRGFLLDLPLYVIMNKRRASKIIGNNKVILNSHKRFFEVRKKFSKIYREYKWDFISLELLFANT